MSDDLALSKPGRAGPRHPWTDARRTALARLRDGGMGWYRIACELDISETAVVKEAGRLGIWKPGYPGGLREPRL